VSQPLILRGEQSGLQTRIATTESVSLCTRGCAAPIKELTALLDL
jgi:hypothetical protein